MKFKVESTLLVLLLVFVVVLHYSRAFPTGDDFDEREFSDYEPLDVHLRIRRTTCNPIACTLHCLAFKKKEGQCKINICRCHN
ncbi:uncharacterized protein LOC142324412 isoform X1 [Lycorma delicatula]|uniref:uncharacterized protein LOC142324412 isoform X1 n=1 Tax=Lycorma delicatula TaxID=130591 RepID=UPI003F514119